MSEEKKHWLAGKPSNNTKLSENKAESFIHARCKTSDKAAWVRESRAKGMKLTEWLVDILNAAVKKD